MARFRAVILVEVETDSLQQAAGMLAAVPLLRDPAAGVIRSAELTKVEKVGA